MYSYLVIDVRSPVVPPNTLGIEVTDARIARMCDLGNIDPQHGGSAWGNLALGEAERMGLAACDEALTWSLPPIGATLATIRPDLDSVAAMAVLSMRGGYRWATVGVVMPMLRQRVIAVARADAFVASGEWQPRPLPTPEQPWNDGGAVEDRRDLAAINAVAQDRDYMLKIRVAVVAAWLLGGDDPSDADCLTALRACVTADPAEGAPEMVRMILREARERVEAARRDLVAALSPRPFVPCPTDSVDRALAVAYPHARHAPLMTVEHLNGVAVVKGSHPGATGLGYCVAPIVVAWNPAHRWPSGSLTKKATVAFYRSPGVDVMKRLAERLNREEAAALCDDVDLAAGGGGGCFVRVGAGGLESASHAIRTGDIETARAIVLTSDGNGWVDEAWVAAMRTRILDLLAGRGWGGDFTSGILGSPQSVDTALSAERIADVVGEVLRDVERRQVS